MTEDDRRYKVYEAEWLAGTRILRHFVNVHEAQTYVNMVVKSRWWKNRTGIARIEVEYVPKWEDDSTMEDHRTTGKMTLTMGCLNEGIVLHELAHCARGDTDNSHGAAFCDMLIQLIARYVTPVLAKRLKEELQLRKLL